MPEGHSIRRIGNVFDSVFAGYRCDLSSPQGRFSAGAALLTGQSMVDVRTKGKHLFLGFSQTPGDVADRWIHTHLGLYGAWRFAGEIPEDSIGAPRVSDPDPGMVRAMAGEVFPPEPRGQVRLRILTDHAVADLNGPNQCAVITEQQMLHVERRLGPDPLAPDALSRAVREDFVQRVRKSGRTVGELVMDQAVSAGVGNIYRAEALFREGISPYRKGSNVSARRLERLWDDFVLLLQRGVVEGAINTIEPEEAIVSEADPEAARWYVYHRQGRPCLRCGTEIRVADLRGRQLYWCSTCQR